MPTAKLVFVRLDFAFLLRVQDLSGSIARHRSGRHIDPKAVSSTFKYVKFSDCMAS